MRIVRLKETQDPNASGSQPTDLPFQQSTPLDPPSSKQDQEIQDLCREILMVQISEVHEPEDDSTECLNLDDYNSNDFDEYLSDNMETTPTITEAQAANKEDLPAPPPSSSGGRHRPTGRATSSRRSLRMSSPTQPEEGVQASAPR